MNRAYFRNLLTEMPRAALMAWHAHGVSGLWLTFCVFALRGMPWPLRLHPGLPLTNWHEAVNYLDNFVQRELRLEAVEAMLHQQSGDVIEVGVNVGITTRWWLTLNPALRVTGIDMIQEALDYTTQRLNEQGDGQRWKAIVGAVGDAAGSLAVRFDDPLEGTNSLDNACGAQTRRVEVNTIDAYLQRTSLTQPLLLKLDIEGHAGAALSGASALLKTVLWVVIEIHHTEELSRCADTLVSHGFRLRHFQGRTMWWSHSDVLS